MSQLPAKTEGVQPVLRSLKLLETLNAAGTATLSSLHNDTGLPKPTLVRLLDTMISAGYVRRVSRSAGYELTERVLRLSSGFRHKDLVVEAARPFLSALTAEHKWPVALATLDHDAMLMRLSTRHESPFSTDPDWLNRRLPMLISALGRAYLAFCPDEERRLLLAMIRSSNATVNAQARDEKYVSSMLATIRERGYATTAPMKGDSSMGIAVPVRSNGKVAACITIRYIGSTMSEAHAIKRYLAPMQRAADGIAAAHERMLSDG
ncbi:DNA-binding transcriptional regulator [Parvibaculum sp.]|jgi:IclR family transcriptional regulator, mhp operon transcriptional activator|uniref:DNA-binding transcriptional regulator n=1 Tax=Parvibaculum sp. TaxID=2024848 RepID=UPI000C5387FF|nr:DNA-binding transcriptional regulator [Parvibaculum sp.]MAM95399.1 transcriptional regulator [Parvibaculum sp.]HCX67771.1 DNA-binding transcriptional regulator [Rhodobiaceae bacterium]|tara:strand:- start:26131 stop:26922 length:792 start_codon:yes stop_codon:yes gene_type:complete